MTNKNKNLGQTLTEAYQAAHAKSDMGERLLALDALESDITVQTSSPKLMKRGQISRLFKGVGIGAAVCGLVTGVVTGDVGAIAIATTLGGIPGVFGGIIYDGVVPDIIDKKRKTKHQEYVLENVIPYEGLIEKLKQQITEDKQSIMAVDHVEELRQSPKIKEVLKNHPNLIDVFRNAQKITPVADIPRVAANNNAYTVEKDTKGFSL